MTNDKCSSFLKWPGGKKWLSNYIVDILSFELRNTYYEPFLGGGAVFFSLKPRNAILSDINSDLINCYKGVRDKPKAVLQNVWRWSNSKECYYHVRKSKPRTDVGNAARLIYLTRTSWGGIYRLNKQGKFNVPFGNSGRLICHASQIMNCSKVLKNKILQIGDFESHIQKAKKGDVIYADPPYTTRGSDNGFRRYNEKLFAWRDQERLSIACNKARKRGAFVIISSLCIFRCNPATDSGAIRPLIPV